MPELAGRLRQLATSWSADLLLAAIVVGWSLAYLGLIAAPQDRRWPVLAYVLPYAAALAVRRRWPVAAARVACGCRCRPVASASSRRHYRPASAAGQARRAASGAGTARPARDYALAGLVWQNVSTMLGRARPSLTR